MVAGGLESLSGETLAKLIIGILRNCDNRKVVIAEEDLMIPLPDYEVFELIEIRDPFSIILQIRKTTDD